MLEPLTANLPLCRTILPLQLLFLWQNMPATANTARPVCVSPLPLLLWSAGTLTQRHTVWVKPLAGPVATNFGGAKALVKWSQCRLRTSAMIWGSPSISYLTQTMSMSICLYWSYWRLNQCCRRPCMFDPGLWCTSFVQHSAGLKRNTPPPAQWPGIRIWAPEMRPKCRERLWF